RTLAGSQPGTAFDACRHGRSACGVLCRGCTQCGACGLHRSPTYEWPGRRLGLLSNFSADLRTMLAQQDLLRPFDALAISAEIGIMKPDAAAYQAVLAMMQMEAHTCVFIDDVPANVAAAQAVGLHGIVFED